MNVKNQQMDSGDQIDRKRLSDEVRERIENLIMSGELAPGDKVPSERDLMQRFGVGRPAIREALFALQRTGIVALGNGARAKVTSPSPERMIQELSPSVKFFLADEDGERAFQEVRMMFEVALARNAAVNATEDDVIALKKSLDANKRAMSNVEEFQESDVAFHLRLALISRNAILKAIHDAIEVWLMKQRRQSLMISAAMKSAYDFHRRIYQAIANRDPDAAEQAMREHLTAVSDFYWRAVRKR